MFFYFTEGIDANCSHNKEEVKLLNEKAKSGEKVIGVLSEELGTVVYRLSFIVMYSANYV